MAQRQGPRLPGDARVTTRHRDSDVTITQYDYGTTQTSDPQNVTFTLFDLVIFRSAGPKQST